MTLQLDDIQAAAVQGRPTPYAAVYVLLRVDDASAGRELLRRLIPSVASAADVRGNGQLSVSVVLSYQGLAAIGVPQASLDSFPVEFREGMAARAEKLGDVGESAPEHWEAPLGSPDVHIGVSAIAPDRAMLDSAMQRAEQTLREIDGVTEIWRLNADVLPTEKEAFGFRDGIGQPAIEGTGIPGSNPHEAPLKAGEFFLGYEDETGSIRPFPQPDVLGRNGTYVVFRKLHQRVASFRQFLVANASNPAAQELLAAKMVGRWPSGAPLALAPDRDDPEIGADPARRNSFLYEADDPKGLKTPRGSHIRRTNPRDSTVLGVPRLHRMIRRGTSYGPLLPEGVLEDDGAERGLAFLFVGAHLDRQFEFVQHEWVNAGVFIGANEERDPIVGANNAGTFTVPQAPIRRRVQGIPQFVITRGGEYFFAPGLGALRWLANLDG